MTRSTSKPGPESFSQTVIVHLNPNNTDSCWLIEKIIPIYQIVIGQQLSSSAVFNQRQGTGL